VKSIHYYSSEVQPTSRPTAGEGVGPDEDDGSHREDGRCVVLVRRS
jgi:hypothetical protein